MSFNIIANTRNAFTRAALKFRFEKMEARKSLKRASVFGFLLFALWINGFVHHIWARVIFVVLGLYCFMNLLSFLMTSIYLYFKKPLYGTAQQRKLLNCKEATPVIKPLPKVRVKLKENNLKVAYFTPLKRYKQQSFLASTPTKRFTRKLNGELKRKALHQDFIADEQSLQAYLKEYEHAQLAENVDYNTVERTNAQTQAGRLLQTSVYQLATDNKLQVPLLITNCTSNLQTEMFAHMSFDQLSQYVLSLRHWISITILKPLINEIDEINAIFERVYLSEFRIGETGLEHLRNLVNQTQFITEHARRLPMIIPYLEICANQIYLLERLRSLANGAWLGSYTCRMFTTINFRNLPNDASIIFQCFCNYMDRQLLPLTEDGVVCQRVFYDNYVIMNVGQYPVKQLHTLIRNRTGCAVLCTDSIRPKFNLITNDKLYYGQYGFNNLFHVLLGFLTYLKRNENGMLEGVSLGSNGINILRVIGEMD